MPMEVWISGWWEGYSVGEVFLLQQRRLDLGLWIPMWKRCEERLESKSLSSLGFHTPSLDGQGECREGTAEERRALRESIRSQSGFYLCLIQIPNPCGQGTNTHTMPGKPVAEQGSQSWGLCSLCLLPDLHMSRLQGRDLKSLEHRLLLARGPGRVAEQSGDWQNT